MSNERGKKQKYAVQQFRPAAVTKPASCSMSTAYSRCTGIRSVLKNTCICDRMERFTRTIVVRIKAFKSKEEEEKERGTPLLCAGKKKWIRVVFDTPLLCLREAKKEGGDIIETIIHSHGVKPARLCRSSLPY